MDKYTLLNSLKRKYEKLSPDEKNEIDSQLHNRHRDMLYKRRINSKILYYNKGLIEEKSKLEKEKKELIERIKLQHNRTSKSKSKSKSKSRSKNTGNVSTKISEINKRISEIDKRISEINHETNMDVNEQIADIFYKERDENPITVLTVLSDIEDLIEELTGNIENLQIIQNRLEHTKNLFKKELIDNLILIIKYIEIRKRKTYISLMRETVDPNQTSFNDLPPDVILKIYGKKMKKSKKKKKKKKKKSKKN